MNQMQLSNNIIFTDSADNYPSSLPDRVIAVSTGEDVVEIQNGVTQLWFSSNASGVKILKTESQGYTDLPMTLWLPFRTDDANIKSLQSGVMIEGHTPDSAPTDQCH